MMWQDIEFPINLDTPPQIFMMGNSRHGSAPVEKYRFPLLWCLHLYTYEAEIIIDGHKIPILPGFASVVQPGCSIEYRYERRLVSHLYAHFTLPPASDHTVVRAMQDTSTAFERLYQNFDLAISCCKTNPHRAQSIIWQLLWELACLPTDVRTAGPKTSVGEWVSPTGQLGLVRLAIELIEERLGEALTVGGLANDLRVSNNHLTRQFREQTGSTVVGFIQRRRMERAFSLLTHTDRSITSIAAEVGIPNIQHFNKTVRRLLGASPSEIRASRTAGPDIEVREH